MAQLDDLKPGAKVKGIIPGQSVSIVDVKWHGSTAVELLYRRTDGQPGQLLFRNDEPRLAIAETRRAWQFNADGELFRLVAEAHRIIRPTPLASGFRMTREQLSIPDHLPHLIKANWREQDL